MTLTLTIFIKIRVSSSTRVDFLWDGTCVSLSFDNFSIIIDHQWKTPERLFSMIDYENPIIEQHYRLYHQRNFDLQPTVQSTVCH